uniref:Triosephosphate isomerase, cytosolic n=1 Tax=Lactuca sativa TaxID=4236 RepID=A0A9R1V1U1_LACSA|nr:hypothetical protein LSAT_V11C700355470 [Lactuca sativa]
MDEDYWTTLAPNVEDYSTKAAKLIVAGLGQLVKGILWCGDVTVYRLIKGNEILKLKIGPASNKAVNPELLRAIHSYLYAKCFASTLWEIVCKEDPLSLETGTVIRTKLLQHGGAKDPAQLLNVLACDGITRSYQNQGHGGEAAMEEERRKEEESHIKLEEEQEIDKLQVHHFQPLTCEITQTTTSELRPEIQVAAQNCWVKKGGAFTGEVSAKMLANLGVPWVILGHSERRALLNETNEFVGDKVAYALSPGLKVIACVGETLEQREAGTTMEVVAAQTKAIAGSEHKPYLS